LKSIAGITIRYRYRAVCQHAPPGRSGLDRSQGCDRTAQQKFIGSRANPLIAQWLPSHACKFGEQG